MRKYLAAFLAMFAGVFFLGASPASAAVDPALKTAVEGGFADVTSLVTGTLVPALLGLVIMGIVIAVAIKYLRRGSSKA